jgi:hypothetical protein
LFIEKLEEKLPKTMGLVHPLKKKKLIQLVYPYNSSKYPIPFWGPNAFIVEIK